MNENMRDVTSKRPLTRVINVTRSQSCEMTTFSTGISSLFFNMRKEQIFELNDQVRIAAQKVI